jgi:hypothetical protein
MAVDYIAEGSGAHMSDTSQLTSEALALPLPDRVRLAQALWSSLQATDDSADPDDEARVLAVAERRDSELDNGSVKGIRHDDVMLVARRSLRCE